MYFSQNIPLRLKDSPKVQPQRLQFAKWLGNTSALVIVADNDIYLRTSPSKDEEYRLTFTGKPDVVYNGVPDWLYQGKSTYTVPGFILKIYSYHKAFCKGKTTLPKMGTKNLSYFETLIQYKGKWDFTLRTRRSPNVYDAL